MSEKALITLKVILGAAWADGTLQPEELPTLKTAVQHLGLSDYPGLRDLIQTPMSGDDYRQAFRDFLAACPTQPERQYLLDTVTRLVYVDDQVSVEEAYILDQLRTALDGLEPDDDVLNLNQFQALFSQLLGRFQTQANSTQGG
ncbi:MAG: hypothetical protein OHK0012_25060 [Synechococcales cyanobacterium]